MVGANKFVRVVNKLWAQWLNKTVVFISTLIYVKHYRDYSTKSICVFFKVHNMHLQIEMLAVNSVLWRCMEVEVSGTKGLFGAIWKSDVEFSILKYCSEVAESHLNLCWNLQVSVAVQIQI